jgi:hypothetical protein
MKALFQKQAIVFSLILVPIPKAFGIGTPRFLPLDYYLSLFDYRQKNPLKYYSLSQASKMRK